MDNDNDGLTRDELLLSTRWSEATRTISLEAAGLLSTLIGIAAERGATEIPVSLGNVEGHIATAQDRAKYQAYYAELRLAGLIREVKPGVYSIAPGLWKVGRWDPDDKDFFPLA